MKCAIILAATSIAVSMAVAMPQAPREPVPIILSSLRVPDKPQTTPTTATSGLHAAASRVPHRLLTLAAPVHIYKHLWPRQSPTAQPVV